MTLPPYMHHRLAAPTVAGAFDEYHRRLPKTTSLIESDATRDLKAITALNNMGCLPNASVVKLCHDDRFVNLVCDILNTTDTHSLAPCSLTHPTTTTNTTATGATTITTAMSEQQEDNISDAMIDYSLIDSYNNAPNLGGENTRFELANEVVETPLVSSTTVRSPDNNMVGSSATPTKKKRKAEEDEPAAAHYLPSLYLDSDSLKFDKHCPILHMVAKKTKTSTAGTSSSSSNS